MGVQVVKWDEGYGCFIDQGACFVVGAYIPSRAKMPAPSSAIPTILTFLDVNRINQFEARVS